MNAFFTNAGGQVKTRTTNAVAKTDGKDEDVTPSVPSTDAGLDETERILEDYVTLLSRSNRVALTH